ncbi:MAG: hypothetical protein FGM52_08800, partial [Mycobacterium sp.]|nr:hypothetical protein [Mycobacterium sp.]
MPMKTSPLPVWLGAGILGVGMGAALLGAGVAHADRGDAAGAGQESRRGGAKAPESPRSAPNPAAAAATKSARPVPGAARIPNAAPTSGLIRPLVGNGTAEHPDAGILLGNGYSWTGYGGVCTAGPCHGG